MANIGVALVVFFLILAGLMIVFNWLIHVYVRNVIGRRHQAIETIHNSGTRPLGWSDAKINRLFQYIRKTRLIENEEVRTLLLQDVERLLEQNNRRGIL